MVLPVVSAKSRVWELHPDALGTGSDTPLRWGASRAAATPDLVGMGLVREAFANQFCDDRNP
jgi:hypothetical protein